MSGGSKKAPHPELFSTTRSYYYLCGGGLGRKKRSLVYVCHTSSTTKVKLSFSRVHRSARRDHKTEQGETARMPDACWYIDAGQDKHRFFVFFEK